MEGCLRSAGCRKKALNLCKGRMLAEDHSFKVVRNPARDPGADKRGLLRSGQVLSHGKDTGGACSLPAPRNSSRESAGVGTAQLFPFIGTCLLGQTLRGAEGVPVAECL